MTDKLFEDINNYYQDKSLTYKKERITVRPENKAINNAINQGLKNPADYRYLYTKCFKPDNIWYDIFLNLNTNYEESVRVEIWAEEIQGEEE